MTSLLVGHKYNNYQFVSVSPLINTKEPVLEPPRDDLIVRVMECIHKTLRILDTIESVNYGQESFTHLLQNSERPIQNIFEPKNSNSTRDYIIISSKTLRLFIDHLKILHDNYTEEDDYLHSSSVEIPLISISKVMQILWQSLILGRPRDSEGEIVKYDGFSFALVNREENRISIVVFNERKVLGIGSFSKVVSVFDIFAKEWRALKIPKEQAPQCISRVSNEAIVLKKIHAPEVRPYIHEPPHRIYNIVHVSHANYFLGALYPQYDCALIDIIRTPQKIPFKWTPNLRDRACFQILKAVDYLREAGFFQLDLKRDNVMVRQNSSEEELPVFYIADFGDVHELSYYQGLIKNRVTKLDIAYTTEYTFPNELKALGAAVKNREWTKFELLSNQLTVLHTGIIFYQIICKGGFPFAVTSENFPDDNSSPDNYYFKKAEAQSLLKDLTLRMLNREGCYRPSAENALIEMDKFYKP